MSSLPVSSSSQGWSRVQLLKHPWWRSLTLLVLLALSVTICLLVMGTTPQGEGLTLTFMQMWMIAFLPYVVGCTCVLITKPAAKIRMLLDALQDPAGYVPIDIAKEQLLRSVASLATAYPALEVLPVCADYTSDFALPLPSKPVSQRVAYFPGSTIGNFDREPAKHFLQQIAKACQGGGLLIGVDLKKDFNILHRAYNDSQGVTARFNLHLLERMNRERKAHGQEEKGSCISQVKQNWSLVIELFGCSLAHAHPGTSMRCLTST